MPHASPRGDSVVTAYSPAIHQPTAPAMYDPLPTRFRTQAVVEPAPKVRPPTDLPPLPAVNWSSIGAKAPVLRPDSWDPESALPKVDAVILTWTTSEGAALSHVFGAGNDSSPNAGDDPR